MIKLRATPDMDTKDCTYVNACIAELVAALRALVKDVEDYSRDEGYTEPDTLEQARAVLAKANA